jgi:hypothetical protein
MKTNLQEVLPLGFLQRVKQPRSSTKFLRSSDLSFNYRAHRHTLLSLTA